MIIIIRSILTQETADKKAHLGDKIYARGNKS